MVATVVLCCVVYRCTAKVVLLHVHIIHGNAVVKVRGNAGERSSWAQTLLASVPRPHTAVNSSMSRSRGPLQLTVGLQIFSEFPGPKIYALTTGNASSYLTELCTAASTVVEHWGDELV